jgi:hypothetical protein
MTCSRNRLHLGLSEWIGLAALALTPASGFTAWGYAVSQRLAIVEANQGHLIEIVERLNSRDDRERLVRLESEVAELRRALLDR